MYCFTDVPSAENVACLINVRGAVSTARSVVYSIWLLWRRDLEEALYLFTLFSDLAKVIKIQYKQQVKLVDYTQYIKESVVPDEEDTVMSHSHYLQVQAELRALPEESTSFCECLLIHPVLESARYLQLEAREQRTLQSQVHANFIVFHRNSSSVYPCREIDMAVFEAPL